MSATRQIRPMIEADIAAIQSLDYDAHGEAWSHRTYVDDIAADDRIHLVAECDEAVVAHAAAWIDGPSCRITNVAVDKAAAGQGHASAVLLAVLQDVLRTRAVANVILEVRPSNRRAQRLYNRFGFVPVAIERNFYDRGDASGSNDAIVMAVVDVSSAPWRDRLSQISAAVQGVAA